MTIRRCISKAKQSVQTASNELRFYSVVILASVAIVTGLDLSPLGRLIETRVELPLSFQAREELGKSPAIDPRLKILALDDASVLQLGSTEISIKQWASLIDGLARVNPKAIVIDKVFGHLFADSEQIDSLRAAFQNYGNVSLGAYLGRTSVLNRTPLNLDVPQFRVQSLLADQATPPPWLTPNPGTVYGPDVRLGRNHRVGQINDFGDGYIAPLLLVGVDKVIPHLALSAFDTLRIKPDHIEVAGNKIPADSRGLVPANFPGLTQLYARTKAIAPFVKKTEAGKEITSIGEQDIVLIIPLHYSGNFDVRSTPIGQISGGYYHAAVINSALTGQWLSPAGSMRFAVYAFTSILGIFVGITFRHVYFAVALACSVAIIGVGSLFAFTYADQITPWFLTSTSFAIASISAFAHRARAEELKAVRLRGALKGLVSDKHLDLIINQPEAINAKPVEKVISLMFIDIVGFSLLAEEHPPDVIFNHIKKVFARIAKRIHEHGGTIDRTLGDGLFAFFGYSLDGSDTPGNQADDAISCAISIQNDNVDEIMAASKVGGFVTPLRIGINTASVYVGDIGSEGRVDFTVIGNGVNFAKRLESACDLNAIMLSPATLDLASLFRLNTPGMAKRLIQIKHHTEAIEALEYDPFTGSNKKAEATKAFYKSKEIERKDQRWPILDKSLFKLETEFGKALLADFSNRGIAIELDQFLAKGVTFKLYIDSADGFLQKVLDSNSIEFIECEIRWGRPAEGKFLHGVAIKNLNDGQLAEFTDGLRYCIGGIRSIRSAS